MCGTLNLVVKNMNIEVESLNGILYVKDYGIRVEWIERHLIILRKVLMSYRCRHFKVALVDLFGRVNVIGL